MKTLMRVVVISLVLFGLVGFGYSAGKPANVPSKPTAGVDSGILTITKVSADGLWQMVHKKWFLAKAPVIEECDDLIGLLPLPLTVIADFEVIPIEAGYVVRTLEKSVKVGNVFEPIQSQTEVYKVEEVEGVLIEVPFLVCDKLSSKPNGFGFYKKP